MKFYLSIKKQIIGGFSLLFFIFIAFGMNIMGLTKSLGDVSQTLSMSEVLAAEVGESRLEGNALNQPNNDLQDLVIVFENEVWFYTIVYGLTFGFLIIALGFFLMRGITQPLNILQKISIELANGHGDLSKGFPVTGNNEFSTTSLACNHFVESVHKVMLKAQQDIGSMVGACEDVSATAQSLSQAASGQAASIEQTSAELEQMSSSIVLNTENAKQTDTMAISVARKAEQGGKAVAETVSSMKAIAEKIVLIEDIAYKTNLLALNAAIEAARAGDHGKGFAVVADEVRKLAERSQISSQEISELSSSSLKIAQNAGSLLDEIVPEIAKTADLVQEIFAASEEQNESVKQVSLAVSSLDSVAQSNASASERLTSTAADIKSQVAEFGKTLGYFKVNVDANRVSLIAAAQRDRDPKIVKKEKSIISSLKNSQLNSASINMPKREYVSVNRSTLEKKSNPSTPISMKKNTSPVAKILGKPDKKHSSPEADICKEIDEKNLTTGTTHKGTINVSNKKDLNSSEQKIVINEKDFEPFTE